MKQEQIERSPVLPSRHLRHLDLVCRWAEALVDRETARLNESGDEPLEPVSRIDAESIEREIALLADQARAENAPLPLDMMERNACLDELDTRIFRLALAPSLDQHFRRRIARYRDNILLDFADVDFVLSVLLAGRLERLAALERLMPGSRLVSEGLVDLILPRDASSPTLLAHEIRVPDRVMNQALGIDIPDRRVARFCAVTHPDVPLDAVVADQEVLGKILALVRGSLRRPDGSPGPGATLGISGESGTGKSLLADAIATAAGLPLVSVDAARMNEETSSDDALDLVFLEARVRGAVLALDRCDAILGTRSPRLPTMLARMDRHPGVVLLLTSDPRMIDPAVERHVAWSINLSAPDAAGREQLWRRNVPEAAEGTGYDLAGLALNFEFHGAQIHNAVAVARELASSRGADTPTQEDLVSGAWSQVRADLEEYSTRRRVPLTLDDLILPDEEKKHVAEVLDAARFRTFIMTRWGFGKRITTGKGLVCLFLGEPGTGKTLCAEILADALERNLYQISIPRVMSKYIGETEKNIERIFQTARANRSILLFDEADALFTSRVKVETSVDRFSNMEINLLLQEIERFDGIVLLTTNLEKNLDKAFERRIQFKIRFPFPDRHHRALIWKSHFPKECPLDSDIDWELLGERFELSGGNIKNAVLRAAWRAARDGTAVSIAHIADAAEAECRHAGRLFRTLPSEDD
jgi:SpoVK/Ycf46/Vps4 family AAA+-type ATPase